MGYHLRLGNRTNKQRMESRWLPTQSKEGLQMNCWHCHTKLTWGGDHDIDEETTLFGDYSMVTNLTCPECDSFVLVYLPKDDEDE